MSTRPAQARTEIDSLPTELDESARRVMQLQIEREALKKEKDAASRERLGKLEKELAELKAHADALRPAGKRKRVCRQGSDSEGRNRPDED